MVLERDLQRAPGVAELELGLCSKGRARDPTGVTI